MEAIVLHQTARLQRVSENAGKIESKYATNAYLAFQPPTSTKLKLSVGLLYTLVKPPQTAD